MYVRELRLHDFRNYRDAAVQLSPGVNIFVGDNAQGKTNLLEAIYVLAVGRSHRTHRDTDLVAWGRPSLTLDATVCLRERDLRFHMEMGTHGKRVQVNGVQLAKMSDFIGHFQVVLFAPEDLALVKGGPGVRRRFMDLELAQTERVYLFHLGLYHRALRHRNALLKSEPVDWQSLEVFESQLVEHGSHLLTRRLRFVQQMEPLVNRVYARLSDNRERLTLRYTCSVPDLASSASPGNSAPPPPKATCEAFRAALAANRTRDRRLGYTSVGPHRDDVTLCLDDKPVHAFASQGQQRSVALSLRLAELDFIRAEVGEYPVLLLDDVLSELDDTRQRNLIWSISENLQTVITATALRSFSPGLPAGARLFHVRSGIIQEEG